MRDDVKRRAACRLIHRSMVERTTDNTGLIIPNFYKDSNVEVHPNTENGLDRSTILGGGCAKTVQQDSQSKLLQVFCPWNWNRTIAPVAGLGVASTQGSHIGASYCQHSSIDDGLDGTIDEGSGRTVRVEINDIELISLLHLSRRVLEQAGLTTGSIHNVSGIAALNTNTSGTVRKSIGIGIGIVLALIDEDIVQPIEGNVLLGQLDCHLLQVIDHNLPNTRDFLPIAHGSQTRCCQGVENAHPVGRAALGPDALPPILRLGILLQLGLDVGIIDLGPSLSSLAQDLLLLGLDAPALGAALGV
mmetsp:Transcript_33182/g.97903  ORF Transcript_33182/g.97903 Transcript_33182/m.97903 type:complete len:303 (-) Transcript_33182:254-1162(-)